VCPFSGVKSNFEPIVDIIHVLSRRFGGQAVAAFLSEHEGALLERQITRQDIKSFTEICTENLARHTEPIVKLIHLRRYYEIVNEKGLPYQLISNLLHKRATPFHSVSGQQVPLEQGDVDRATESIREHVKDFDYQQLLARISSAGQVRALYAQADSNYEKLQLFRIATGEATGDSVLRKYINETFHIENDYVMQLNPCTFSTTPNYIVAKCDAEMEALGG
jgi:hypothetical protein